MMTPPNEDQGRYATKVLVTAPMPFQMVKRWENTTVGHRGEDYETWKRERADELLTQMEEVYPGFRDAIEAINTASPLTIRDFYGVKEGSICGFAKNCQNMPLSQVPVVTKVRNLLLTGQNNNLHGFCGVPLTAINTCEAILGLNYVVNKINEVK
jgi:phytoene dehydrogenase-like protein